MNVVPMIANDAPDPGPRGPRDSSVMSVPSKHVDVHEAKPEKLEWSGWATNERIAEAHQVAMRHVSSRSGPADSEKQVRVLSKLTRTPNPARAPMRFALCGHATGEVLPRDQPLFGA